MGGRDKSIVELLLCTHIVNVDAKSNDDLAPLGVQKGLYTKA